MKKLKILIVTSLALLLCFMCIVNTTFSWFTRPKELSGNALMFTNRDYDISSKEDSYFAINTYESTDGKTYGDSPVTAFPNSSELQPGARKYYRTDIINSGSHDQTLSLYLTNMQLNSTTGNFFLGVNEPTRTYKQYGGSTSSTGKVASTINKQNVYLALESVEVGEGKLTNNIDYVHAWNGSGVIVDTYYSSMKDLGKTGNYTDDYGWKSERTYNIYSATIDSRCTSFMLKTKYNDWMPPQPTISSNNTLIFYEFKNIYYAEARNFGVAAKLESFYSSASVGVGSSINIQATATGSSIQYESSNNNVAKVDSNGNVVGVSAGSATIKVKVYGAYGDLIEASCNVQVTSSATSFTDIPIVTNVYVPKGEGTETGQTIQSVYWYIKNDATSGDLKYTISDLYLTL